MCGSALALSFLLYTTVALGQASSQDQITFLKVIYEFTSSNKLELKMLLVKSNPKQSDKAEGILFSASPFPRPCVFSVFL